MAIHLGRRKSREGWLSFETDSHLSRTKERLHRRCIPCLSGLLEQLKAGPERIELREAWNCWKIVTLASGEEECLEILRAFEGEFPNEAVCGKIGGGVGRETSAVIFHTESEERRDQLCTMLASALRVFSPGKGVFHSRGCGNPYELLLGPWRHWEPVSPILHPERVGAVKEGLRRSLYGSY